MRNIWKLPKDVIQSLGGIQTPAYDIFIIFLYVNNCTLKKSSQIVAQSHLVGEVGCIEI